MNDILERMNKILVDTEKKISDLENKVVESILAEQQKEKRIFKYEDSLRDLRDNIKNTNTPIIGVPEREKREKRAETYLKKL